MPHADILDFGHAPDGDAVIPEFSSTHQAQLVVDTIHERTSLQIDGLRVELVEGVMMITGRTRSPYTRQLAFRAALDALEFQGKTPFNAIEVTS
jgi:hypothetical protein